MIRGNDLINIQGLLKTTLLDYPGHVAATVFLGGCNMRCPFCHNMNIVKTTEPAYSEEDILGFLSKRRGILDGVCITGGEPTVSPELPDLIRKIRDLGFMIKLDTNGTNPTVLKELLEEGLLDYVAMDIKASPSFYARACGVPGLDLTDIIRSTDILINSGYDYEFRTTAVAEFLDESGIRDIGEMIKGARKYFLQGYVESEFVPDKSLHALSAKKLLEYRQELLHYVDVVELRGID